MRHEAYELRQMQAMPLEMKIRMTKERIETWYESWTRFEILNPKTKKTRSKTIDTRDKWREPEIKENEIIQSVYDGQIYVAFSGGKDSTVLKHMVDSMYKDVPSVFMDTGLEYPEIRKFALSQTNVIALKPNKSFRDVLLEYGYPVIGKEVATRINCAKRAIERGQMDSVDVLKFKGEYRNARGELSMFNRPKYGYLLNAPFKISASCCYAMKKSPSNAYASKTGRKAVMATMAQESQLRFEKWLKHGCNAFDAVHPNSAPMSFWTEQDVLHYIAKYNIPYCKEIYGDIVRKPQKQDCDGQVTWNEVLDEPFSESDLLETTGAKRTGCVFCMFGCHLEKQPNRFQRLKQTHPQLWNYCINGGEFNEDGMWQPSRTGLGLGFVLDYIGVPYE